jgi:hypothetical protein
MESNTLVNFGDTLQLTEDEYVNTLAIKQCTIILSKLDI